MTPTLSLTAGLRYDWNGGLTEKEGRIFNFDPTLYNYNESTDTITNPGFIIAGNNKNGTPGVSNTTLTGRQWGIAPRLGLAWQPPKFRWKSRRPHRLWYVLRPRSALHLLLTRLCNRHRYRRTLWREPAASLRDRAELPHGYSVQLLHSHLRRAGADGGDPFAPPTIAPNAYTGNLANPYTNVKSPAPTNPQSSDLVNYLPNIAKIENGGQPISLGVYDRANKLPYTFNYTLDIQWQPRNDIAIDIGYVGNVGRPSGYSGSLQSTRTSPTLATYSRREVHLRLLRFRAPIFRMDRHTAPTMKAEMSIIACRISDMRRNPSTI